MQIIQAAPSAQTRRQAALDDALRGMIGGFDKMASDRQTKRQEALQIQKITKDLRDEGYDVNEDMVKKSIVPESGLSKLFAGTKVGEMFGVEKTERPDLYGKRTAAYEEKQKQAAEDRKFKREDAEFDRQYKLEMLNRDRGQKGLQEQKNQLELQKLKNEMAQTVNGAGAVSKFNAEEKNKIGSIASGFRALENMKAAIDDGVGPSYIDSNTPLIGKFISDDAFTENNRVMNEVVGRLQSGGAIGVEEEQRFKAMGPRPGDSPDAQKSKLKNQMAFLDNKLKAYNMKQGDLANMGFDVSPSYVSKKTGSWGTDARAADPAVIKQQLKQMSREEKIRLLQGR